ncbi:MAG: PEP-CTERM sorting domain-containing protein [Fimbriimonadaceae bacterium]|nr:PEP-CTERM sorting domain-containing protein [Fimbriimonadaceae bacterium]
MKWKFNHINVQLCVLCFTCSTVCISKAQTVSGVNLNFEQFSYGSGPYNFNGWEGKVGPEHNITLLFSNYTDTAFRLQDIDFQIFSSWSTTSNFHTSGINLKLVVPDEEIGFGEHQYRRVKIRYEAPFATAPVYGRFRGRFRLRHSGSTYFSRDLYYHLEKEPVPEPATVLTMVSGLAMLVRRRRKR